MLRPRNSVVRQGGLRRRGGTHEATKSGVRQENRRQTFVELEEYFDAQDVDDGRQEARESEGVKSGEKLI